MKLKSLLVTLLFLATFSCQETDLTTVYIANKQADCVGVGPQKCLQVKFENDTEWSLFYDQIEGFTYETGFYYKLQVTKETISNPPADASNIKYTLVEVVKKSTTKIN
ncbi:MAG: hypothetical protein CMC55_01905 [Flavobacteriaceae bacterium]|uniref:DUF4377 domain-containing protein n=1 Tax=Bizionia echini TaxID=649333 RepID=UPI000C89DB97|nr:hypothetical protein [Flavobacteriaceae bacterium]